ncbi:MAG: hypothetical protein ACRDNL_17810 [Spirillospora sp.]
MSGTALALKSITTGRTVSLTSWIRFRTRVAPAMIRETPTAASVISAAGSSAAMFQSMCTVPKAETMP